MRQESAEYTQLPLSAQRANRAATTNGQKAVKQPNITEAPEVLREPTPYNLNSLRDLYTQVPDTPEKLKRFGSEVFLSRSMGVATRLGGSASVPSLDVPIGPDYVVGPGDSLTINMWGGVSQTMMRTIDRNGSLMLPEAGEVQVAGLTLERTQEAIDHALRQPDLIEVLSEILHQVDGIELRLNQATIRAVRRETQTSSGQRLQRLRNSFHANIDLR